MQQLRYFLPEPYVGWERQYLADLPDLQRVMDVMVGTTARQLADPDQDILHNRVCAALAYRMASDMDLPGNDRRLVTAGDLLHNISKEDRTQVLTDAHLMREASEMVTRLRGAGRLDGSPSFWSDPGLFARSAVGADLSLVHHITGAVAAGGILESMTGYPRQDILRVQETIVTHSTGYFYFRESVDRAACAAGAWRNVFPEPGDRLAAIVHDADLVSQFDPASVLPAGSKWRSLAAKRWGARNAVEEAHVTHYVLRRLVQEARTPRGKALAAEAWATIEPELVKRMGLAAGSDPMHALGIPRAFQ